MVDDCPADRRLFEILLRETYGPRLEFFEEGTATCGLEACRARRPDCLLLDYKLPDLTGIEFLRRLRADESADFPEFAVVMLTGLASGQVAAAALKGGAQDYLPKSPMTAEVLSLGIEKATQKVTLLRTLKAERDRLADSLAEKEVLLKEVHHRVKNNFQVIASLLRLQANVFENNEEICRPLRESQSRVESMALVHEQLYQGDSLREVDMARHASQLAANMFYSYGIDQTRISWHVDIEPLSLAIDQAIPVGLILNELFSNALRHAFPGNRSGSIWIEGFVDQDRVVLSVRDDGIGVPEASGPSTRGSVGLQIIGVLTRQLKGRIELERGPDTTFRLIFPKEQRVNAIHRLAKSAGSGR